MTEKDGFDFTPEGFCKCGTSLDRHTGMGCLYRPASPIKYEPIDVCDVVYHIPSDEKWVVALVEGDRLYWVGYPYGGSANLSDCRLVTKATSEERESLIEKLAALRGDDVPTLRARARLTKRAPDVAEQAVTESGLFNCQVCGEEKCSQPGICEACLTPPAEDEVKSWGVA